MQAKTFLIVLIIKMVNGESQFCDIENPNCKISEANVSYPEATDLTAMVKYAMKYFNDLSEESHNKMNAIADDIASIKKSFQTRDTQPIGCPNSLKQLPKTQEVKTITEVPSSLYDNLWVIIQRRQEGAVSFYRSWVHYAEGFGNPFREFFIGLNKIYYLTNSRPHELLIKLNDYKGKLKYALYDEFLIGNQTEKYQLKKLGNYSGNAGDYLRAHEGMYFSTRDKDNDANNNLNCARLYKGGWWYNNCMTSNLNGPFRSRYELNSINMTWGKNNETQFKIVQMMLRSKPLRSVSNQD